MNWFELTIDGPNKLPIRVCREHVAAIRPNELNGETTVVMLVSGYVICAAEKFPEVWDRLQAAVSNLGPVCSTKREAE